MKPHKPINRSMVALYRRYREQHRSYSDIADALGISLSTLKRRRKEMPELQDIDRELKR